MSDAASDARWQALARDLDRLHAELSKKVGAADVRHLRKMERWGRLCSILGYATAWIAPNPLSAALISLGNTARFTIVAHHVGHGALDAVPGVPVHRTRRGFAAGARRILDWPDWILPEAWLHEHNVLHHYHTGESEDPDIVELNAHRLRAARLPLLVKYAVVAFHACTWKMTYYAPNTLHHLSLRRRRRASASRRPAARNAYLRNFLPIGGEAGELWARCLLPYAALRFAIVPLLFLPLGASAVLSVLVSSLLAEVMTNLHTFLVVVPSHAGDDLFRFEGKAGSRAEFYRRQILGSTNYRTGGDLCDFLHGYLNYQIEHHLFPDLPPLRLREAEPAVRALCAKHGVPHVEDGVIRRAQKLLDIFVGKASMRTSAASGNADRNPLEGRTPTWIT